MSCLTKDGKAKRGIESADFDGRAKADRTRTGFAENAKFLKPFPRLDAGLRLQDAAAGPPVIDEDDILVRIKVALRLQGKIRRQVESKPPAKSCLRDGVPKINAREESTEGIVLDLLHTQ